MAFPIILPVGTVAVYGLGEEFIPGGHNPFNMTMPSNFRFGSVYHIWDGGTPYVSLYDIIMFQEKDVFDRIVVTSTGHPFTVVPARLATRQYEEL